MISIIIPSFNEGENLTHLIESLASFEAEKEIIVVDASSASSSKKLTQQLRNDNQHQQIHIIDNAQSGRARQMNQGAAIASQDILLFLHCDSQLPDNALEAIKNCCAIGYNWGRFTIRLDDTRGLFRIIAFMINLRSRCRRIATGDQAIFVRRDLFYAHGQFPDIPLMEDIALSRDLGKRNPPALINSPVITSARRWKKHGVIRTILLMWKLRLLFWLGVSPVKLAEMYKSNR